MRKPSASSSIYPQKSKLPPVTEEEDHGELQRHNAEQAKGIGKTGTPCGWNRLLNGDSTPAATASAAAARGGDFLVAARGWGRVCADDFFGSILGMVGWMERGRRRRAAAD
jgi:hypothetical protein